MGDPGWTLMQTLPGPLNLLVGFLLVMFVFSGALLFTYWISKDE